MIVKCISRITALLHRIYSPRSRTEPYDLLNPLPKNCTNLCGNIIQTFDNILILFEFSVIICLWYGTYKLMSFMYISIGADVVFFIKYGRKG